MSVKDQDFQDLVKRVSALEKVEADRSAVRKFMDKWIGAVLGGVALAVSTWLFTAVRDLQLSAARTENTLVFYQREVDRLQGSVDRLQSIVYKIGDLLAEGKVIRVEGTVLVFRDSEGKERRVELADDGQVRYGQLLGKLSDLKTGQAVKITFAAGQKGKAALIEIEPQ